MDEFQGVSLFAIAIMNGIVVLKKIRDAFGEI